jgi:hypothetical protein
MRNTEAKKPYLVNSIRWELEREGIEDFEYLWLLRDCIERASRMAPEPKELVEARKVLQEAENLVRRPAKSKDYPEYKLDFEENPNKLYEARERIGDSIEVLKNLLDKSS